MPRGWFTKCLYAYISGFQQGRERESENQTEQERARWQNASERKKPPPNLNVLLQFKRRIQLSEYKECI